MRYVDARSYVAGTFVWTGFDYGGESIAHYWPGVVSHFGILDYCGFPKDAFWYYKAWWTETPVLHILPHWNGIGKDSVNVNLYTNMDEVELFLNGKSLGKKTVGRFDIPAWRVQYVPGKLLAKGKKDGKKYTTLVETTGKPATLQLVNEKGTIIKGDGNDLAIITVKVLDAKGEVVPMAENRVHFDIRNGKILGVGNGHPSSHEPDVFPLGNDVYRNAFGGYVQVLITSDRSEKPIELIAVSDGLKESKIVVQTVE